MVCALGSPPAPLRCGVLPPGCSSLVAGGDLGCWPTLCLDSIWDEPHLPPRYTDAAMFFGQFAGLVGASLMEDFLNFQCYCFLINEMTHNMKKFPFTFYVLVQGNSVCCMFYLGPGGN